MLGRPTRPDATPYLCERCWYPIHADQPIEVWHPRLPSAPFAPLWRCFAHRGTLCPEPRWTPRAA